MAGSPLALPSRGPRGIPSHVVEITWIAVATSLISGKFPSINVAIQLPRMAAECRGNCCGNCRGFPWQLPWISVAIALYRRITAYGRGNCRGLTSAEIAVAIAADFCGNCRVSEDCRDNYRGWPWKLLWFDVRGNCRGNCRGLPW